MQFNKQKIVEIVLTALMSALIAFLQGMLSNIGGANLPSADPVVAGGIGAGLRAYLNIKKC